MAATRNYSMLFFSLPSDGSSAAPCSDGGGGGDDDGRLLPTHDPIFLDHKLWSCISPELLELLLCRLPLSSLLRSRLVCKRWASLILSPGFLELWVRSTQRSLRRTLPWAVFFARCAAAAPLPQASHHTGGDPGAVRRWYKKNAIRFTPSQQRKECDQGRQQLVGLSRWHWHRLDLDFVPLLTCVEHLSSSGGLLLLSLSPSELLVINPLTKAWRVLPPLLSHISWVALVADPGSTSYKVVAACHKVIVFTSYVYDSTSGSWRTPESVLPVPFGFEAAAPPTLCNGILHSLGTSTIFTFNVQEETWDILPVRWPPEHESGKWSQLLEHQGRLISVMMVKDRLAIWQLNSTQDRWLNVDTIPLFEDWIDDSGKFQWIKIGDILCLSPLCRKRFFTYHLTLKRVQWSANCPYEGPLGSYSSPGLGFSQISGPTPAQFPIWALNLHRPTWPYDPAGGGID
eukprot:c20415_g1_i2 orf=36-1406(-)